MSNTRYIELDSTYRNRSDWPLPANFEVRLAQSGTKGKLDALDPVSLSTPIKSWESNNFNGSSISGSIVSYSGVPSIGASGSQQTLIVQFTTPAATPQRTSDYYVAAMLVDTSVTPVQQRRILSSKFISSVGTTDTIQFTVESSFGDSVVNGDTVQIKDPTDISDTDNPHVFVPAGALGHDSYIRYFLYNDSLSESRPISGYDAITHLLTVDTSQSAVSTTTSGPVTNWLPTHLYNIRKGLPIFTGTLAASTVSTVTFPVGVSTADDFYNGDFIRIKPTAIPGPADNEVRRIVDYDGTTRVAKIFPVFGTSPGAVSFEILPFTFDQAVPLNYTGSTVSQQEMVCYEIELLNLILPNRTLVVGQGSRITFYPYVYVEFTNLTSASAGTNGVIYSNNPNSTRMLFRAAIDDIPNPLLSPFIKIDGDGMVQTVKFSPNDNLRFSVRLPDGTVFETNQIENISPSEPNGEMQISALFAIRRL